MIEVAQCSQAYGGLPVLKQINCSVRAGEIYGIIGPNGSGKSTLLRMISGVERPSAGTVHVAGKDVQSYSRRKLARFMAVLSQEALPPVGFTVREVLEMGRYPHQDWLGRERSREPYADRGRNLFGGKELLDGIMEQLGLAPLASRALDQLSGGERQRVALGKAMAQEPRLLLLDEPTTYLDIGHQLQMMDYVRKWNRQGGLTVVAVLHDLNLAAQYCDRLMVMSEGEVVAVGEPWTILQPDLIEQVYHTRPLVVSHPETGLPQLLLKPETCPLDGSGIMEKAGISGRS